MDETHDQVSADEFRRMYEQYMRLPEILNITVADYEPAQIAGMDQLLAAGREAGLSDAELAILLFPGALQNLIQLILGQPDGAFVLTRDPQLPIALATHLMLKWAGTLRESADLPPL